MENELISKKELLEVTGISYGQLYRWKRKNLIPESWFIRKSAFTGQETFFPKASILERVEKIMNMKDDVSLDELAVMFSPHLVMTKLSSQQIRDRNIVSATSLELFSQINGERQEFDFTHILQLHITDHLLQKGDLTRPEAELLLRTFAHHSSKLDGADISLLVIRKMGVPFILFHSSSEELMLEPGAKVVANIQLYSLAESLKNQLS